MIHLFSLDKDNKRKAVWNNQFDNVLCQTERGENDPFKETWFYDLCCSSCPLGDYSKNPKDR